MHAYRQKIREMPKSIMSKFWIIVDSSLTLHALVYITICMLLLKNSYIAVCVYIIMLIQFKGLFILHDSKLPIYYTHYKDLLRRLYIDLQCSNNLGSHTMYSYTFLNPEKQCIQCNSL